MSVKVSVCSELRSFKGGTRLQIEGLTEEEAERFKGALNGMYWMTSEEGRLKFASVLAPLPGPADDEEMLPFWRRFDPSQAGVQEFLFDPERVDNFSSPGIIIQHLCGYGYTPENYQLELLSSRAGVFTARGHPADSKAVSGSIGIFQPSGVPRATFKTQSRWAEKRIRNSSSLRSSFCGETQASDRSMSPFNGSRCWSSQTSKLHPQRVVFLFHSRSPSFLSITF